MNIKHVIPAAIVAMIAMLASTGAFAQEKKAAPEAKAATVKKAAAPAKSGGRNYTGSILAVDAAKRIVTIKTAAETAEVKTPDSIIHIMIPGRPSMIVNGACALVTGEVDKEKNTIAARGINIYDSKAGISEYATSRQVRGTLSKSGDNLTITAHGKSYDVILSEKPVIMGSIAGAVSDLKTGEKVMNAWVVNTPEGLLAEVLFIDRTAEPAAEKKAVATAPEKKIEKPAAVVAPAAPAVPAKKVEKPAPAVAPAAPAVPEKKVEKPVAPGAPVAPEKKVEKPAAPVKAVVPTTRTKALAPKAVKPAAPDAPGAPVAAVKSAEPKAAVAPVKKSAATSGTVVVAPVKKVKPTSPTAAMK